MILKHSLLWLGICFSDNCSRIMSRRLSSCAGHSLGQSWYKSLKVPSGKPICVETGENPILVPECTNGKANLRSLCLRRLGAIDVKCASHASLVSSFFCKRGRESFTLAQKNEVEGCVADQYERIQIRVYNVE